MNKAINFGD